MSADGSWAELGPGVYYAPEGTQLLTSAGQIIDAMRSAGFQMHPWQRAHLQQILGEKVATRRNRRMAVWPGGKPPAWLQTEAYEHAHAFASELSESSGIPLEECVQAVLNAMSPRKLQPPKVNPIMKPDAAPPMWVRDPARTRRTAFGPTRRVK